MSSISSEPVTGGSRPPRYGAPGGLSGFDGEVDAAPGLKIPAPRITPWLNWSGGCVRVIVTFNLDRLIETALCRAGIEELERSPTDSLPHRHAPAESRGLFRGT